MILGIFNKYFNINIKLVIVFAWLLLLASSDLYSQTVTTGKTLPLFQAEEMLDLRVAANFKEVFSNKDDKTYFPAELRLLNGVDAVRDFNIEIRTRGKTRRLNEICLFPPLRLRFSKTDTKDSPFEAQRAIKLVTHCKKSSLGEQNTIIEYLIYKAFNLLTDSSFKVRAAQINYVYTNQKADSIKRFAFFIEREKHIARRLKGIELESVKLHPNRLTPMHTCLLDMFQYMIGNTDYSVYELHNIILISDPQRKMPPYAVPYDFDWCGLVSAFYAKPNSLLKTETVDERVYRGFKKPIEMINKNIEIFNSKKQEIYNLFNDFELLKRGERKRILKYLDEFYMIINDDKLVKREFIDNARILHN
jgi:hypothetical protein